MGRGRASPSWTWCQQVSRTLGISTLRLDKELDPSCIHGVMVGYRGTHIPSCSGFRWPCPWQSQSSGHQGKVSWQLPGKSWLERKPLERAKLLEGFYSLFSSREIHAGTVKAQVLPVHVGFRNKEQSGSRLPWGHSPSPP